MLARQLDSLTPKGHLRPCFAAPSDVHPDLTEDMFRKALEYARDCTTVLDNGYLPPTARGTFMYHNSIAKICELMAEKSWKSESVKTYLIQSPKTLASRLPLPRATPQPAK